jgi:hypothetical protein
MFFSEFLWKKLIVDVQTNGEFIISGNKYTCLLKLQYNIKIYINRSCMFGSLFSFYL